MSNNGQSSTSCVQKWKVYMYSTLNDVHKRVLMNNMSRMRFTDGTQVTYIQHNIYMYLLLLD